ncbi:MAG: MarR family transcriptional regulator [Fimbriimonadaceae bacterium]|nr:MarR family transcriptional regulator [Fimbriimonadaceae bacterium]
MLPSIAAVMLARSSVAVSRNLTEALEKSFDLHISQYDVLATLFRLNRPQGVPLHELSTQMAVTPASMTNRVDNLAQKGYVERVACPNDRRSWHVTMTPQGEQFFQKVQAEHRNNEAEQFRGLTDAEKRQLVNLLLKLLEPIE